MKVLFINPSRAGQGNIPLNISLLIAILKKYKHEIHLFDMSDYAEFDETQSYEKMFFKEAEFNIGEVLKDRKNFYKKNSDFLLNGLELKQSDYSNDFEKILIGFKPEIIAISCLSVDYKFISEFLEPFKKRYRIPVIFGGIHSVLMPEEVISSPVCDIVCIGEGENCFPKALKTIENKETLESIKGIWFKKNGKIIKNPFVNLTDLTTLPFPDFEHFDPTHFYRPFDGKRYKMLNYELSRGCPFNCTYCVNGVLKEKYRGLGRYHRIKKIEQSINELTYLKQKYNFNFVRFWDEDFTSITGDYLEKYADLYKKEIALPFLIYARTDTVTAKKIEILKEMGCKTFAMGIESGNEFIRRMVMKRRISNRNIIDKFHLVKSYGIRTSAYNMIGFPYETRETVFDTINLNKKVNANSFSVTLLEPYKGTPIRKMCENQGLDVQQETAYNRPQFIPKDMTKEELQGLFRTFPFYIRFPKERYNEIKEAETDERIYRKLREEFSKRYK